MDVVKVAMGRGRVEIKRIENAASRQVTFSKRRGGLLKKAHELAVLCDAQIGVLIFSNRGKLFKYCSSSCSWRELIHRYETISNTQLQETNHDDQQMFAEITRLSHESDHLEASLRRQTGEDLSSVATAEELHNLQQQLESVLGKVRERKDELLNQQLDDSHHKVHILEDQNSFLRHMINEDGQHRAAAETSAVATDEVAPMLPATAFMDFFPEEEASTSLQLWPQVHDVQGFDRVQLAQPNLQDRSLTGLGLRLW